MGLKAILSSLEGLEDSVAALYKKAATGDNFVLDVEPVGGFSLEDVKGLKASLASTREELKAAKGQVKPYLDEEGNLLDAEAAREALSKVDDLTKAADPERVKAAVEAQVGEIKKKHAGELAARDERLKSVTGQLERRLTRDAAMQALTGKTDHAKVLLPHLVDQIKVFEENGEFVARVVGDDGTPRITMKQGEDGPMGLDEAVAEMASSKEFGDFFGGSGASGGGAPRPSTGQRAGTGRFTLTREQARDTARYQAVRAEAEKAGSQVQIIEG